MKIYEFGAGEHIIAEGFYEDVPSCILMTGGSGKVGDNFERMKVVAYEDNVEFVLKFNNKESLEVMIDQLSKLRKEF